MSREKKANAKALRRIREAENTGTTILHLGDLNSRQLPQELERLTSLQTLNLTGCGELSDLGPLAVLTSLQVLALSGCLGVRRVCPPARTLAANVGRPPPVWLQA